MSRRNFRNCSRGSFCLNFLQERLHYESLNQHLNKLGKDAGKMVHRVIDLTRPEDLDGRSYFFFLLATLVSFLAFLYSVCVGNS